MAATIKRLEFAGSDGAILSARLDLPPGQVRAYAIFAHCFTCSKDINAARRISGELARLGIGVLRFDFTGLGSSEGEFASSNFSSNVGDLVRAADFLRDNYAAPQLLVGHSLGGAAVLAAATEIDEVLAVATVAAPADAAHVIENFAAHTDQIRDEGEAEVTLAGRKFKITRQFLEDLERNSVLERVANMHRALLVLHSPVDETVGIQNASDIFLAAKHPKSFVSLDGADHLLTSERDAVFAARTISTWAERYIDEAAEDSEVDTGTAALIRETHNGKFQNAVSVHHHRLLADEPESFGGLDSGPSPYDFLSVALGACTSMTLRMYADRKKLEIGTISVLVDHAKVHADDEAEVEGASSGGKIDQFERRLSFTGEIDSALETKLLEIADKCPVHKTLEANSKIVTKVVQG